MDSITPEELISKEWYNSCWTLKYWKEVGQNQIMFMQNIWHLKEIIMKHLIKQFYCLHFQISFLQGKKFHYHATGSNHHQNQSLVHLGTAFNSALFKVRTCAWLGQSNAKSDLTYYTLQDTCCPFWSIQVLCWWLEIWKTWPTSTVWKIWCTLRLTAMNDTAQCPLFMFSWCHTIWDLNQHFINSFIQSYKLCS